MIVYTGHHEFDFVFESRTRDASFGQFVGTYRWCSAPVILWENSKPGGIGPLLDSLIPIDSDGIGVDGEGVFHGSPRASLAEITKDSADVFGEYPKNLKKQSKIVPINGNLRSRGDLLQSILDLVAKYSNRRTQLSLRDGLSRAASEDVRDLIDRHFKEVPA